MKWLVTLAVLPGILIMLWVYKKDKIEKEPKGLLLKLFVLGAISVIPAALLEIGAGWILESSVTDGLDEILIIAIENFAGVALIEEAGKYFFLKKGSWKHPAFDYRFDGIVYAVVVSMGFAVVENIMYVVENGFGNAIVRALISVPGHASFAICMGAYYGAAKVAESWGDPVQSEKLRAKALWMPVFMHGFFDFCLSVDSWIALIVFFIYIIVVDIVIIKKIKKYSREDTPIYVHNTGAL